MENVIGAAGGLEGAAPIGGVELLTRRIRNLHLEGSVQIQIACPHAAIGLGR
jgi:hypothetical protein